MQSTHLKKPLVKSLLFLALCLTAFIGTARAGLDYYEIYLGKQLVFKRYVNKPLSLENLSLRDADANAQLAVHYYQCNAPGKQGTNRSLLLKDDGGNIVKEWKFADGGEANTAMMIPVKELLQWEKKSKSKSLSLVYVAQGRTEGETLTYLPAGTNAVTRVNRTKSETTNCEIAALPMAAFRLFLNLDE